MNWSRVPRTYGIVFGAILLAACGLFQSWQERYLKSAVNDATKEDIIRRMGPPREIRRYNDGSSLLLYRFREFQAGDLNGPGRWWCEEYRLKLDQDEILRHWSEHGC
ncbi:hypothetical protein [Nitrospira sp. Nam74]